MPLSQDAVKNAVTVNWDDFLRIVRIRAVEESDGECRVWDADTRRSATRGALATGGKRLREKAEVLKYRAQEMLTKARQAFPFDRLQVPSWPAAIVFGGWAVAAVLGWMLAALGQEREINLLSLPLIGILLWNVTMVIWSLLSGWSRQRPSVLADWLALRWQARERTGDGENAALWARVLPRFGTLAHETAWKHLGVKFRAWLHLAAALLAMGSITGMYARGWSREYQAVWESTLLNESSATQFFKVLFTPASMATGIPIPLDDVAGMRRGADEAHRAPRPGDALPWIHLYAATLGLIVVIPRFLLIALEQWRARQLIRQVLQTPDWQSYLKRVLSQVEGSGDGAEALIHGLAQNAPSQERWRQWIYETWQDVGRVDFLNVTVGEEQQFLKQWQAQQPRVVLIFNMAATPEVEVHRALAEELAKKQTLALALDATELRKRWANFADGEQRLEDRATLWKQMLDGLPVTWLRQ